MPRIGFDAVRALRNSTGLGNYARRVLRGVLADASPISARLYTPRPARPAYAAFPEQIGASVGQPPFPWNTPGARTLWRSFRLGGQAARDGMELFHGLSHEIPRDLPRSGLPSVVSFLDLIWLRFPDQYGAIDRRSYQWRYRWSAEQATAIVAVSRQTRRDLIERYGVAAERIVVIPPPADPRFGETVPPAARRAAQGRYALPERFLLSVGTLEPRKNQGCAIAALGLLDPARTPPLVLAGRDGGARRELLRLATQHRVADRVLIRCGVLDADLPALMQSAALFLYPSLFEGFGLPIVEALAAGVPVLASEGGCFPEAGGPGTRYFPARDAAALAGLLRRVLDDPGLAEQMRGAGRIHAGRFAAGPLASRMLALYDAVLQNRPLPADHS